MNFGQLKAQLALWLNRQNLTDVIPTFVATVEGRVNRELRTREMVADERTTLTAGSGSIALPAGWLQAKAFVLESNPTHVFEPATLEQVLERRADGVQGLPKLYCVAGDEIEFAPTADAAYDIRMWFYRAVGLVDDTDENWLLTKYPEIYINGALMQAAPYLFQDPRVATWSSLYNTAFESLRVSDWNAQAGPTGQPLRMRSKALG